MDEFWEESFKEKKAMWGLNPSTSSILVKDYFLEKNIKDILIPGIGYGRNAKIFIENGINVTGIEISKTAIELAEKQRIKIKIYNGSVGDMPFDNKLYEGIFSYSLIHLLDSKEREKFISDCYNQLKPNGEMIFTAVSQKSPMYGKGEKLAENYYKSPSGVKLFFYTKDEIEAEFGKYGLYEVFDIDEFDEENKNKPPINFWIIKCKK